MTESEQVNTKKVIEITPTKTGRRVLVFLADIFLNLIVSIIFFELVVFQISRPIINYDKLLEDNDRLQREQYALLYENGLLYINEKNEEENRFKLSVALEDTNYYFLQFYVNPENEEYSKYDVFYKYFVVIEGDYSESSLSELNSLYVKYGSEYFDTSKTTFLGTYQLKEKYINDFSHNYVPGDEMSLQAQEEYDDFTKKVFLNVYNDMFRSIETTNLYSLDGTRSINGLRSQVDEINDTLNKNYIICSYISFSISSILLFLIYPLITEKRETVGERILKLERVDRQTMGYIKKPLVLNIFLLRLMDSLIILFLIPALRVGFAYIFSFSILYLPSLIGILIAIIDLLITYFTNLNTSLKEITTNSIVCDSSSLDYYYQEKEKFYGK